MRLSRAAKLALTPRSPSSPTERPSSPPSSASTASTALAASSDPSMSAAASHWARAIAYFGPTAQDTCAMPPVLTPIDPHAEDSEVETDQPRGSVDQLTAQLVTHSLQDVTGATQQSVCFANLAAAAQMPTHSTQRRSVPVPRPRSSGSTAMPFSRQLLVAAAAAAGSGARNFPSSVPLRPPQAFDRKISPSR